MLHRMIFLTKAAAEEIARLRQQLASPELALRIFIETGGCGGCGSDYHYGMSFDEKNSDDTEIETNGMKILIDPESRPLLTGAQIDFGSAPGGTTTFLINNPNASKTCGCGRAFS